MIRKRITLTLIIIFLVFGPFGCATLGERWGDLSQDDKCRIIVNDMQDQLINLFEIGKVYVSAHPESQETWKGKIVPAISSANKAIATCILLIEGGDLTPGEAYRFIQPLINEVIGLLVDLGAIKTSSGEGSKWTQS
uniref:Uncharacterized protein n=1 Tax=viral metagenome TaxID=1070528 RepID=A0A6M3LG51_9ZZZZ